MLNFFGTNNIAVHAAAVYASVFVLVHAKNDFLCLYFS